MEYSAYCPINYAINGKIKVQSNNIGLKSVFDLIFYHV